ncbi:MAG: gliding motility-associated C-terminal domain-containing protein [Elusimicrobia bacterium]|nr:gliding motility-associated C-terminal domain-containing protein [Elusimicrobiota bacterium]
MRRRDRILRFWVGAVAGLLWSADVGALEVKIKNVADDEIAPGVVFSTASGAANQYRTGLQYIEIAHPESRFRKVFVYTDNGAAFGQSKEGLVNQDDPGQPPVPFYWRNFPGRPEAFDPGNEWAWTLLLEKSLPEFAVEATKDARALVTPGDDGLSRVAVAFKTPVETERGTYVSRLVLEEISDVADINGPVVDHTPFNDVILVNIPIGVQTTAEDDGSVVSSTFYFRLDGTGLFQPRTTILTPDPVNPFKWMVQATLDPGDVHPGTMDYYFAARDNFENETVTPIYRANLVPEDGAVTRTMSVEGGLTTVPVGDPLLPGLTLDFPPHSLNGDQTLQVTLKPSSNYPSVEGRTPLRVFDLSPDGLRFSRPVTLSIPYPDQDQDGRVDGTGVDETLLRVFWFDGHLWRFVGGQVDPVANRVSVAISHFSVYSLAPLATTLTPDMVRPAEKIITPNGDGQNDYAQFNISGEFTVEFFDLRGERVRRLSGINIWDGRDDDGKLAETGTYIYRLTGQGLTVTGALAVAR